MNPDCTRPYVHDDAETVDPIGFAAALSHVAQAIVITDREGTIIYVNPAFEVLTGFFSQAGIRNSNVPIIALTARAMAGDRENCFAAGMDDYVAKPVEYAVLAQVLVRLPWEDEDSTDRAIEGNVQPPTIHRSF